MSNVIQFPKAKRGRGRPRVHHNLVQQNFRMDDQLKEALRMIAKEHGLKPQEYLRQLVQWDVEQKMAQRQK